NLVNRMMTAFREGNVFKGVVMAPWAAIEKVAEPLMKWWVPRLKMGVFAEMARYELQRLGPNASDIEIRRALARAWDSVDNRLGQLVYDNLFWHKATKDVAMASVRSVGWNVGTV